MLKLPKGLKKKKKGKKPKKDQELFNEEELEKYRREHQNQEKGEEHLQSSSTTGENDDEWSKFKALTAGVDNVLKQKQEDLNRIKSTSFFQRVPTTSELQKQEEEAKEEREKLEEELAVAIKLKRPEIEEERRLAEAVVDLSESESEEEDGDDIFDTAYIDVINAGDVGLVVVESPIAEDGGPDPFDTSYADKVIKGPELSKRGKKLVSIGSAVEVLTGRVGTIQSTVLSRRPRRGPKDLLLEIAEDSVDIEPVAIPEPVKTLLDDASDELSIVPIDLSVSLHIHLQQQKNEDNQHNNQEDTSVVDNFDLNLKFTNNEVEFEQLAVQSLTHKDEVAIVTREHITKAVVETDWSFFEQKAKQSPTSPAIGSKVPAAVSDEDLSFREDSSDPFDTTFVEKIFPATLVEDLNFDPRAEDLSELSKPIKQVLFSPGVKTTNLNFLVKVEATDLLRGSNSDLSQISHSPLAPISINQINEQIENSPSLFDDPFDTTGIETIVAPGKIELRFLENELLSDCGKKLELKHSISDPDFNPRAQDIEIENRIEFTEIASDTRKSSLVLNINNSNPRLVKFSVPSPDFLKTEDNLKLSQKPLTPYYTKQPISLLSGTDINDNDPFDTSFVSDIKPSEVELNLIEKEILSRDLKQSLSDPDFNPRAIENQVATIKEVKQNPPRNRDLLTSDTNDFETKVLTPAVENRIFNLESDCILDPFDTSTVDKNLQPGKGELKVLVNEFVPEKIETDLFEVESQESIFAGKVLTPQPTSFHSEIKEEIEVDPFDTSFAENIQPGRTEIKFIETELINQN